MLTLAVNAESMVVKVNQMSVFKLGLFTFWEQDISEGVVGLLKGYEWLAGHGPTLIVEDHQSFIFV